MLDLVPSYFKVIRHVRPKFSCGHCARVIQEPAPSRPLDRVMAAPGLLAQVIVAKYADHCPLYRQAGIYRRSGVELDRATLAAWVGGAARLLDPLVAALGRYVRAAEKVHADDTPVPVLDPGRGKTKTGRLWTYVRDDRPAGSRDPPAVWYRYSPDRKSEHPQAHLRGFRGILQADAYSGFARLYEDGRDRGSGVLGARAAQVLRPLRRGSLADCHRGAATHRRALRDRARHPRQPPGAARPRAPGARRAAARRLARLAHRDAADGLGEVRPRRGDQVRAGPLDRRSPAIATTAASRSTTTAPSARFGRWSSVGAITCSPAPTPVASARPASTA